MSDHHHRPAPRRQPVLARNQRLLLLAALALAVFWYGAAMLSVYAVAGSLLLGGAAIALSFEPQQPHADPADVPRAVELAAQAMSSGWGPTSWEHCDPGQRAQILAWARAAVRAYLVAEQTSGRGADR